MTPLGHLREGEYVQHVCVAVTVNAHGMLEALNADIRSATRIYDNLRKYNRAVRIRIGHVEGVSYGNPQLIHRGRKPTARRR